MDDWALPTIRLGRCTRCGLCVTYCPTHAVEMVDAPPAGLRPAIMRPQDCAYCGNCEEICPAGAIVLTYEIVASCPSHSDGS